MNKRNIKVMTLCAVALMPMLTGCIDNNYSLADLDTTSQFAVNDLVLPVNIDEIPMTSIIDIDDNDNLQIINGSYCIVKQGTFESSEISIAAVNLHCDPLEPSTRTFDISGVTPAILAAAPIEFDLSTAPSPFSLTTASVPESISAITEVGVNMQLTISLSLRGLESNLRGFQIKGLKLQLPKGLKEVSGNGTYNDKTGIFSVTDQYINGSTATLVINVGKINLAAAGIVYNPTDHTIVFDNTLSVQSATAVLTASDIINASNLPNEVTYMTTYAVSDISVKTFSGEFTYAIDNVDFPSVDLADLPDLLKQEGTNISIVNPQLYLTITNPAASDHLRGQFGVSITAMRGDEVGATYTMDEPLTVQALATSAYCLAPTQPEVYPSHMNFVTFHTYSDLGRILSGESMPTALDIKVLNPELPRQEVTDFALDRTLGKISGEYYFKAPLQLAAGSQIKYISDINGWWSEDMDKLVIKKLTITANVTSDVPISLNFIGYPIDRDGNRIGNVEITGGNVPAYAINYPLTITLSGEVTGLDGIRYEAVAAPAPGEDATALADTMEIILSQIRAKVSGNYTTEL